MTFSLVLGRNTVLPLVVLLFLLLVQFIIYVDRGIIPGMTELALLRSAPSMMYVLGCTMELNSFVSNSVNTSRPSMYIGILQAAFILGVSCGCPIFAHFSHKTTPSTLLAYGLLAWCFAGKLNTPKIKTLNCLMVETRMGLWHLCST